MNFKLNKILLFVFFVLLASCSKKEHEIKFIDGDDLIPPEPPFWEYFEVYGHDVDNDGVRDDLELWINTFEDRNIRLAMKNEMRAFTELMKTTSVAEALIVQNKHTAASTCLAFVTLVPTMLDRRLFSEIHGERFEKLLNNWWRGNQFNKGGKYLPSGVYSAGSVMPFDMFRACSFKIKNLKKVVEEIDGMKLLTKSEKEKFSNYFKETND